MRFNILAIATSIAYHLQIYQNSLLLCEQPAIIQAHCATNSYSQ